MREVVGDEVGAFEEQENITEAVTLQGTVQGNPVSILTETHTLVKLCLPTPAALINSTLCCPQIKLFNHSFSCFKKIHFLFFFFYPWSAPVEFGKDTPT